MNERTQTRLAWALSASLLTVGWLWRYLPETTAADTGLACVDSAPRAVALVVPEPTDSDAGERVYVYWLDSPRVEHAPEHALRKPRAPNETQQSGSESGWRFVGSTLLGEPGSIDPVPIR